MVPLFSLGVVRPDLQALKTSRARMHIGGTTNSASKPNDNWRVEWTENLGELAEVAKDLRDARIEAAYRQLILDLPKLSLDQARKRCSAIGK